MAVSLVRRLAASARVPAYLAPGYGEQATALQLATDPRLEVVASPRHATVLVIVGAVAADHAPALRRLHDQLPHPRCVVWWTAEPLSPAARGVLPTVEEVRTDPAATLVDIHRDLILGDRASATAVGPGQNPTRWRGVGPHGQGGEGMMGGVPYGRAMAMTGEDVRDGLALDRVPLTLGPFHSALPPGLTLELQLQGDVIVACEARRHDTPPWLGSPTSDDAALDRRLVFVANVLRVHGLAPLADRIVRAAIEGDDVRVTRLLAVARRRLLPALRGVGVIDGVDALGRWDDVLVDGSSPSLALDGLGPNLVGLEWAEAVTTVWTTIGSVHRAEEAWT